ncbi:uncharacterized protein LOC110876305 [Helianthus annuus]|uniref:uncharacterized protein LOC110876305 n=1 Tax=Helianthus annuus TaxID=4232 RepID=UPI000B8F9108|nr:uncharacterized protein LOC110876305 [Helianthus annuus]
MEVLDSWNIRVITSFSFECIELLHHARNNINKFGKIYVIILKTIWRWKRQLVSREEQREWAELNCIETVRLSVDSKDAWTWLGDGSRNFSVELLKKMMVMDNDYSENYVIEWCKWTPLKFNIFVWRTEKNRIPMHSALIRRNVNLDSDACGLCDEGSGSAEHLFTACEVVSRVWLFIGNWLRLPPMLIFSFKDLMEFHRTSNLGKREAEIVHDIIITACWCVWKARNEKVFSMKEPSVNSIIGEIKSLVFLWLKYRSRYKDLSWVD